MRVPSWKISLGKANRAAMPWGHVQAPWRCVDNITGAIHYSVSKSHTSIQNKTKPGTNRAAQGWQNSIRLGLGHQCFQASGSRTGKMNYDTRFHL